ncbi:peroxisomal membrane protein PMP34 [Neocloeon triangulifer]|uniref:peroxisomal membrane protein PMP34 n=1 Tax=Neocloeon triangulifer TaxID=2078957 RepID=UPI00286F7832|nr:peroxisomal membrane protein PMP34 [Neocloeon triangulifer]
MSHSKPAGLSNLFTYKTLVHAVAGATGSVVAMATFYPLDTVRSRLQLEEKRESKNTVEVIKDLVNDEGFFTLYRGMVPVLQSLCCSNFVYFYTFHGLKSMRTKPAQQNAGRDLMLAALAGIVNVCVTTPLWVVNTRLKMKGIGAKSGSHGETEVPFNGLIDGLKYIARTEGVLALWKGTMPSLLLVTNPSLQFMAYESIKRRLMAGKKVGAELGSLTVFFAGAAAKALATIATYPLQIVQAKLRHGHTYPNLRKNANMFELIVYIIKIHGVEGLFKGMEAKILQTISTAALMFVAYEKIAAFVFRILLMQKSK